jgi:hypothetical protein
MAALQRIPAVATESEYATYLPMQKVENSRIDNVHAGSGIIAVLRVPLESHFDSVCGSWSKSVYRMAASLCPVLGLPRAR